MYTLSRKQHICTNTRTCVWQWFLIDVNAHCSLYKHAIYMPHHCQVSCTCSLLQSPILYVSYIDWSIMTQWYNQETEVTRHSAYMSVVTRCFSRYSRPCMCSAWWGGVSYRWIDDLDKNSFYFVLHFELVQWSLTAKAVTVVTTPNSLKGAGGNYA